MNGLRRSLAFLSRPGVWMLVCILLTSFSVRAGEPLSLAYSEFQSGSGEQQPLTGHLLGNKLADVVVVQRVDDTPEAILFSWTEDEWVHATSISLPDTTRFVDVARIGDHQRLIVYSPPYLQWMDPGTGKAMPITEITTSLKLNRHRVPPRISITRDVNQDGRDDLVLPDTDGFWFVVQGEGGMFQSPLKLGSPEPFLDVPGEAEMTLRQLGLTPETNRDYQRRVHSMDYDGDERTDLVFWNGASFDVHLQESSGQFRLSATEMAVQGQFDFDGAYGVLGSYQDAGTFGLLTGMRKRSSRTVLHAVRDMDGDGVADLVTLTFSGRSLLRQRMTLSVYKGRRTAGRTVIEPEALATLALPGSPTALTYASLTIHDTDDGDALLMYHHVSTSPLQFARVVLGRRLKTTVYFYQLKQGELSATPDRILPLKGPGFPVLLLGDLTGDGSAELMVTQVRDSIQIYGGVPQNLWDTEAESVSFDMHRYEGNTWLADIGPGKRKGLVGWRPSETDPNRISVLMGSDGTL